MLCHHFCNPLFMCWLTRWLSKDNLGSSNTTTKTSVNEPTVICLYTNTSSTMFIIDFMMKISLLQNQIHCNLLFLLIVILSISKPLLWFRATTPLKKMLQHHTIKAISKSSFMFLFGSKNEYVQQISKKELLSSITQPIKTLKGTFCDNSFFPPIFEKKVEILTSAETFRYTMCAKYSLQNHLLGKKISQIINFLYWHNNGQHSGLCNSTMQ